ncbi:hypothetical protein ACIPPS_01885 [Streptomyces sp. NPDC090127]|uniref:hypothetical protein n=1 Tax=Streptomyces sp. NPDC090127 TaxID=3365953 RepID=UPI003826F83C
MDWLTPLTGLVGVLVGAATSYLSTHQAQKQQLEDARLVREETGRIATVAANAHALTALLGHVRKMPPDSALNDYASAEYDQLLAAEQSWAQELLEYLEPARVAALEVRDEQLRTLLTDGLGWIHDWEWVELGPYRRSREWLMQGTIHHLLECVFAWRRCDVALPEPNGRYLRYKEAWEYAEEVRRISFEEAAEGRRNR